MQSHLLIHLYFVKEIIISTTQQLLTPFHNSCCGFSSNLNYNYDKNYGTEGVLFTEQLENPHGTDTTWLIPPLKKCWSVHTWHDHLFTFSLQKLKYDALIE
jgi:hypothetical protein